MSKNVKSTYLPFSITNSLDSLLKYTFAALLFFIPLYPKFPLFSVPGTYVAIRAEDFLIGFLGLIMLGLLTKSDFRSLIFRQPITKAIIVFFVVGLISTLSGVFLTHTATPSVAFFNLARRIEYLLPFFAAIYLCTNPKNLRFFLKLLLPIAALVFLYGIAQLYFQAPVISTQNAEFAKGYALTLQPGVNLSSTFAGHYDLAAYLTMTLILGSALLFTYKHRLLKLLHTLLLISLFWLLLQTGSRITFFTTALSLVLLFWFLKRKALILAVVALSLIGALSTPALASRFSTLIKIFEFSRIQQKVKGVFDNRRSLIPITYALESTTSPTPTVVVPPPPQRAIQEDRSTSIRFDVEWPRAIRALTKNPLLGTGYASITLATDNDYLRALGETGVLGLLSFLTIFIFLATNYLKALKTHPATLNRHLILSQLLTLFSFLIIAIFLDIFESSKPAILFWMSAGLAYTPSITRSS